MINLMAKIEKKYFLKISLCLFLLYKIYINDISTFLDYKNKKVKS